VRRRILTPRMAEIMANRAFRRAAEIVGRNADCPCNSGLKSKKCHLKGRTA
jgi:hypothetical protein